MSDISKISVSGTSYDVRDKVATKRGAGAPTTATTGSVGQIYEDTANGDIYNCTSTSGGIYTWVKVGVPNNVVYWAQPSTPATPSPWISAQDIIRGAITDIIYPVGSIYMSATLDTPAKVHNALGGTWVAWGSGRVPVGVDSSQTEFDTAEETGGEKTHKLVIAEMPSHTHTQNAHSHYFDRWATYAAGSSTSGGFYSPSTSWSQDGYANQNVSNTTATNQNTGGGGEHNNLQPYITCYMWKRTD